jgi:hypothetical protein
MTNEILVIRGQSATYSFLLNLDPNPIAIVSIQLCDIAAEGDPAYLIYNHIKDFYMNYPTIFIDLQFNFKMADGLEQYAGEVNRAVERLTLCVFFFFVCNVKRINNV